MSEMVHVDDEVPRMPVHGKIRFANHKTAKAPGRAIDTFRFTSIDREAIEQIAAEHGGEVKRWEDQWEVFSEASTIDVWLPPTRDQALVRRRELWEKGNCLRRCDGLDVLTPDGTGWSSSACICAAKKLMECAPKTRLQVILPGVRFGGVWVLTSSGMSVWEEMPGMVDMILGLQTGAGMPVAELALSKRQASGGKRFIVPVLRTKATPMEIMSGGGQATAISAGPTADTPALGPASAAREVFLEAREQQRRDLDSDAANPSFEEVEVVDDEPVLDVDPVTGIVDAEIVHDSWATVAEAVRESGLQRADLEKREDGRWHPKV